VKEITFILQDDCNSQLSVGIYAQYLKFHKHKIRHETYSLDS